MSEETLKTKALTDLLDLMIISVNELIALHRKRAFREMAEKNEEVQLIQKIIALKRLAMLNNI